MVRRRVMLGCLWVILWTCGSALPGAIARRAAAACTGDCDGSGDVTVNEIIAMVNIALGNLPLSACPAGDADGLSDITINDIIAAVNSALNGCGGALPTATPTPTQTPTSAPTMTTHAVSVGPGLSFSPSQLTVHVGETVEWTWAGSDHNVVSGSGCAADGQFCSPNDSNCSQTPLSGRGTVYRHTFTTAGTYPYFCSNHCRMGMVGSITVEP
jgi:plastocyanin